MVRRCQGRSIRAERGFLCRRGPQVLPPRGPNHRVHL